MSLSGSHKKYLKEVEGKARGFGYASFDQYLESRIFRSLFDISKELEVPYGIFAGFYAAYYRQKLGKVSMLTKSDFEGIFKGGSGGKK